MRSLRRNQQKLWYATYGEKVPILDDEGFDSGEFEISYSAPVEFGANIAMSSGESQSDEFGLNVSDYNAIIITCDMTLPIAETSVIWHKTKPVILENGTADGESADYKVISVKPSLNSVKYLLKRLPKDNDGV